MKGDSVWDKWVRVIGRMYDAKMHYFWGEIEKHSEVHGVIMELLCLQLLQIAEMAGEYVDHNDNT